jgi:hypothetical protein
MTQRGFLTALLAIWLTGCSAVYSTNPVGEKPYPIKEKDWKGIWLNKDAVISIKVVDEANGTIKMAWVEWKDREAKLECYEVLLRQWEQWVFGNVKDQNKDGKVIYFWAPIKFSEDQFLCWRPKAEKFREMGKEGKLPCREEGDSDCILGDLSPEHLRIMTSQIEQLYEWDDPLVFVRIIKSN